MSVTSTRQCAISSAAYLEHSLNPEFAAGGCDALSQGPLERDRLGHPPPARAVRRLGIEVDRVDGIVAASRVGFGFGCERVAKESREQQRKRGRTDTISYRPPSCSSLQAGLSERTACTREAPSVCTERWPGPGAVGSCWLGRVLELMRAGGEERRRERARGRPGQRSRLGCEPYCCRYRVGV